VPVNGAADLYRSPQYRHRGFFRPVRHPVLGDAQYPTVPYTFGASPARITSPASALGQHTAPVLEGLGGPRAPRVGPARQLKQPGTRRGGPLQGVRVVELTKVWAGPHTGKLLAMLGAEGIKVETAALPEEMRAYGGTEINHAPYFLSINPEILSVDLDIKSAEGMRRLRELIAQSDIVVNNLRPGAMERQGLGYEQLAAIKPDIISVSIKTWGNDGPLGHQTGYAPCFAALAGDPRYATMGERHRHSGALDRDLAALTRDLDAEHLAHRLREVGVPANKSATALDVIGDQRLWDRGLYRFVTDHREGQRPIVGPSWRMARDPARIARGAPDLGEDTGYVLNEILGAGSPTGGTA
jgi:crotonobetainyl-CoA:carnitine CoA-transferase CaiB-like acyl-CoA transferase